MNLGTCRAIRVTTSSSSRHTIIEPSTGNVVAWSEAWGKGAEPYLEQGDSDKALSGLRDQAHYSLRARDRGEADNPRDRV